MAAAPPGMILVMKMPGSSGIWGLSVPPAMLKPRPEFPCKETQYELTLPPNKEQETQEEAESLGGKEGESPGKTTLVADQAGSPSLDSVQEWGRTGDLSKLHL